jgi:glutamyl aminopeptidase
MLTKRELKLLEKVTQIDAIPGLEQELAKFVKGELEKYGFTIVTDNLGSVFGVKKSKVTQAPRIMVAGHLDEVGFSVREITDKGFIRVDARGGINANTMLASRVRLTLDDGTKLMRKAAYTSHLAPRKTTKQKRQLRKARLVHKSDAKRIKYLIQN